MGLILGMIGIFIVLFALSTGITMLVMKHRNKHK